MAVSGRQNVSDEIKIMNKEKTKIGDRFAASFLLLFASFLTASIVWFLVVFLIGKAGGLFNFPFEYVLYFTGAFTFLAFISPNKAIDSMGWIWGKIDSLFKEINRG